MSLFAKAEADRIAATVTEVERHTAGEIVVAEVTRSDDYLDVRLFVTLLVGLCAASGAHLIWPALEVGAVLALQFAVGGLAFGLTYVSALLRPLVPKARARLAVERAAELAFLEHNVFSTRDRTGVLIFLSALEHRVVILGDQGIHERVKEPGWSELVTVLVSAIKAGHAVEGVCDVVQKLGEVLARDAPVRHDDIDELDNRVRSS